ncbi:MAG: terpene cyclase/mutase family protein [Chloroflexota bacterium]|nr:terpene cyclase/mutase family protein [Chloroflexota bacterium]
MASATDYLLRTQNADGGWGYRAGGMSYVEPTAAVIFALRQAQGKLLRNDDARILSEVEGRARDFLLSIQRADGGWGIGALDAESGWMTAWAVRALNQFADASDATARGVQWLIDTEGLRVTDAQDRAIIYQRLQIDSTLRGWPWQRGDAAWVHPTALAILALSEAGKRNEPRIRDGIVYLFDRAVARGGWNIGNPEMLDKPVPATIQDTAITLLALRAAGESAGDAHIAKGIQFLRDQLAGAKTPAELTWGIYALRGQGDDLADALARLVALQSADGSWQGNPFITAIAATGSQK